MPPGPTVDPARPPDGGGFDLLAVGQRGRVGYEACLLAATLAAHDRGFPGRLIVAEPQPGPLWPDDPRMDDAQRGLLHDLGAEIRPFESRRFGHDYPHGNKIEALRVLEPDRGFLFLDSDTAVLAPLGGLPVATSAPTASMNRSDTWPTEYTLYGPEREEIWASLYGMFDLDYASSLDTDHPPGAWRRNLYFNAGWFCGPKAGPFAERYADWAARVRDDPPAAARFQSYDPWLDQVVLPLVVHSLGGGRPGAGFAALDDGATWHWRALPLAWATGTNAALEALRAAAAPNPVKKVLKRYDPFRLFLYQNRGRRARALFEDGLPRKEQAVRNRLKSQGLWMR
ncbi:hypothetical protein BCF33_0362 [Hasllibacter halocynthiae]|uniref:Glycosyl transferase family 8 n=1 Tax=Hasllibacter halocynthiae TaxID=595589 RepID=A0A2T0X7B2_9RHOB|nr:hypothetical protein [Hasllibacter halocynthiae]PRY94764.1 hypothetical protein BCF33_0362 [Hasllibacter halocynthiae]